MRKDSESDPLEATDEKADGPAIVIETVARVASLPVRSGP